MAKSQSTKIKLVDKASIEFAHYGARAVGVDQLCKAAGINKGSFYHYYPSKQALIVACIEAEWDVLRDKLLAPAFSPEIEPLERIQTFFQIVTGRQKAFHAEHGIYPGCLMCTLGSELGPEDEVVREKVKEYYRRNTAYLYTAFKEGSDDRSVKQDPERLAEEASLIIPAAFLQVRSLQNLKPLELANELILRFARQPAAF